MVPLVERAAADRYDPQPIFLVLFISRPGSMCFIQAPSMWWKRDMTVPDFKAGFTALNRFGFGARGDGDLASAASDPRGFLKAELVQPGIALLEGPGMPRTALALQAMFAEEDQKKAERERMAVEAAAQPAMATDTAMPANRNIMVASPPLQTANMGPPKPPSPEQLVYRAEALARFQRAAQAR